jgi:hypothetical protein
MTAKYADPMRSRAEMMVSQSGLGAATSYAMVLRRLRRMMFRAESPIY